MSHDHPIVQQFHVPHWQKHKVFSLLDNRSNFATVTYFTASQFWLPDNQFNKVTFIPILLHTACVITSRDNQGAAAGVDAIGEWQLKRAKLRKAIYL